MTEYDFAPIPDELHEEWGDDLHEMRNGVREAVRNDQSPMPGAPKGVILIGAVDTMGIIPEYAEELLNQLLMAGVIYEPSERRYALV